MRTKPTDNKTKNAAMKHLHFLLLTLASSPAFSSELRIDPARLQDQVLQRSEQASQQGAAPSAPAEWLIEPTAPARGYGQGGVGHGAATKQGQGYGQGYERRYGQASDRNETGSVASPGGMGHGASPSSGLGGVGAGGRGGGRH